MEPVRGSELFLGFGLVGPLAEGSVAVGLGLSRDDVREYAITTTKHNYDLTEILSDSRDRNQVNCHQ